MVYKVVQPRHNLWKRIKEPPERLIATLPRYFFLKTSFTFLFSISSVRTACVLVLLKPAPLCTLCPKHSAQTNAPACLQRH